MNLSYNTHFASKRPDGRLASSLAAHMEQMRRTKPLLALPEEISPEEFPVWKNKVCEKIRELLLLPEFSDPIAKVSYLDGVKVYFQDGGWIIARFSGTEPLLRIFCEQSTREQAEEKCLRFASFLSLDATKEQR